MVGCAGHSTLQVSCVGRVAGLCGLPGVAWLPCSVDNFVVMADPAARQQWDNP